MPVLSVTHSVTQSMIDFGDSTKSKLLFVHTSSSWVFRLTFSVLFYLGSGRIFQDWNLKADLMTPTDSVTRTSQANTQLTIRHNLYSSQVSTFKLHKLHPHPHPAVQPEWTRRSSFPVSFSPSLLPSPLAVSLSVQIQISPQNLPFSNLQVHVDRKTLTVEYSPLPFPRWLLQLLDPLNPSSFKWHQMDHKVRIFCSLSLCLLLLVSLMEEDSRLKGRTVLTEAHHGMKHLYRLLKKTRFVPIPIIIPVHHSHQ